MAWRLGDLVEFGEINCTRYFSIFGYLKLRGHETPLHINLTGQPPAELCGKRFRFEPRPGTQDFDDTDASRPQRIAWEQIGPPGEFTVSKRVRVFDASPEECQRLLEAGTSPPTVWRNCLYLEWYSQNGRVVIELIDPQIEFVTPEQAEAERLEFEAESNRLGETFEAQSPESPADTVSWDDSLPFDESDEDTDFQVDWEPSSETDGDEEGIEGDLEDDSTAGGHADDPYGLFPHELHRHFEDQSLETDLAMRDGDDAERTIRETELMDELIVHGKADELASLLSDPAELRSVEELDDAQLGVALHSLLAELALCGIALDVCEHFTPRDVYRFLVEELIPHETAHRELRFTQWVQHFSTWEHCAQCEAEFERKYAEGKTSGDAGSQAPPEPGG